MDTWFEGYENVGESSRDASVYKSGRLLHWRLKILCALLYIAFGTPGVEDSLMTVARARCPFLKLYFYILQIARCDRWRFTLAKHKLRSAIGCDLLVHTTYYAVESVARSKSTDDPVLTCKY